MGSEEKIEDQEQGEVGKMRLDFVSDILRNLLDLNRREEDVGKSFEMLEFNCNPKQSKKSCIKSKRQDLKRGGATERAGIRQEKQTRLSALSIGLFRHFLCQYLQSLYVISTSV
ncbi:hypothetical protein RRG08_055705 [Elysia crispata]|uniref:Uncharacterized protein n=1 Tax=Elysia crispata TaxID=231223 RepID=A0AAE1B0Z5_9GAST|nr:hypothetical protein RRG08_055705 [Elysia crispata]